jgi:hypothetical protein
MIGDGRDRAEYVGKYVLTDIATYAAQEEPYFLCGTRAVVQVMYLEGQTAEQLGKLRRKINTVVFFGLDEDTHRNIWEGEGIGSEVGTPRI